MQQARRGEPPTAQSQMRALLLSGVRQLELRAVPCPAPLAYEVRIRVAAVGLCGTDFHIYAGHSNYHRDETGRLIPLSEQPQILGQEIVGMIEEVGRDVRDIRPGDRVVVDQGRTCAGEGRMPRCEYCASGNSHQCEFYREHGITGLPGGFAEYVTVPALNVVRIDGQLAASSAAVTEPLGCVLHACQVLDRTPARYRIRSPEPQGVRCILICGAGPSGLLFVQYFRNVLGFDGLLLVSEPNASRRALAEQFGADTIDPAVADVAEVVAQRTAGRRAELLIDAAGDAAMFTAIPRLIRKQATVLLYAHGHAGADLSALNQLQFMEPTLLSTVGASGGYERDGRPSTYVNALRLIESGQITVAPMITHRYSSLESLPAVFAGEHRAAGYVKGVLELGS
jgi:L-iditol 2-dehydrogenase